MSAFCVQLVSDVANYNRTPTEHKNSVIVSNCEHNCDSIKQEFSVIVSSSSNRISFIPMLILLFAARARSILDNFPSKRLFLLLNIYLLPNIWYTTRTNIVLLNEIKISVIISHFLQNIQEHINIRDITQNNLYCERTK